MDNITPESWWVEIENRVNSAEELERRFNRSQVTIYADTSLTEEKRSNLSSEKILELCKRRRITERALVEGSLFKEQVLRIIGDEESPENRLIKLRWKNLIVALRTVRDYENRITFLQKEEIRTLEEIKGEPNEFELKELKEIRDEIQAIQREKEELLQSTPEAFLGLHLRELKKYKDQLTKGRIVETPYVEKMIKRIVKHFNNDRPVLIHGHFGTGKTELAMHVAREYIGKEALVISGSKDISLAEIYGHQVLEVDKIKQKEIDGLIKKVEKKYEEWLADHSEVSEHEKHRAHDRILQTYLTTLKGGTISKFFFGPIYRAMQQGCPIIIDEVNAIPHELLISLNHILTRSVGDTIDVQQDTGEQITINKGFGVIMTGNLITEISKQYVGRQKMCPAFISRLFTIHYNYLGQTSDGSLEEEAGKENELYLLLLIKVIDANGNLEAPKGTLLKLWNLAKAARITQEVFAGREIDSSFYFQEAGGRATPYFLKEGVMSIRALHNIISQWQKEGYKYELDHYIWEEFISQSTVPHDRAYLYQLLKDRFGFFQSHGWEQNPNYGSSGRLPSFDIESPENGPEANEFLGPRKVVKAAFGNPPERTEWPVIEVPEEGDVSNEMIDEQRALQHYIEVELPKQMRTLKDDIEYYCAGCKASEENSG